MRSSWEPTGSRLTRAASLTWALAVICAVGLALGPLPASAAQAHPHATKSYIFFANYSVAGAGGSIGRANLDGKALRRNFITGSAGAATRSAAPNSTGPMSTSASSPALPGRGESPCTASTSTGPTSAQAGAARAQRSDGPGSTVPTLTRTSSPAQRLRQGSQSRATTSTGLTSAAEPRAGQSAGPPSPVPTSTSTSSPAPTCPAASLCTVTTSTGPTTADHKAAGTRLGERC